jgi:transcriptional regulator with XRE-family HTH domain
LALTGTYGAGKLDMDNQTLTLGEARMSFGETLARLRKRAKMKQTDLALAAGVPIDTLRRWEQGRSMPKINDAYRLAKALGVGIDKVILGKDMETTEEPKKTRKPKK